MHNPTTSSRARTRTGALGQLRDRSKRLYGNADRLQVAYAVAKSSGVVHAQELSDALLISPPRVRAQLLTFAEAGLMRVLPRSGHIQNYEMVKDPFWAVTVSYVDASMRDPMEELGLRSEDPASSEQRTPAV
jgi:hypothetical protein